MDWALDWKPKGRQFNSQSGHMPGLWATSPVGGHSRGNHTLMFHTLIFPSLSPSHPLSKIQKINFFSQLQNHFNIKSTPFPSKACFVLEIWNGRGWCFWLILFYFSSSLILSVTSFFRPLQGESLARKSARKRSKLIIDQAIFPLALFSLDLTRIWTWLIVLRCNDLGSW